jgi:tRNA threonylcarbamoyladenosine biosynthesis protein TsaB
MNILAIDTAAACSVAVACDERIAARRHADIARGHAEALMPMIDAALAEAGVGYDDLDLIAAAVGPGSFTGLRTGLAAARGLALALGVPTCGVSSLEAAAAAAACGERVLVALESKRPDIYVQSFDATLAPLGEPAVVSPDDILGMTPAPPFSVTGDAAQRLKGRLSARFIEQVMPGDAAIVAAIAVQRGTPKRPEALRPLYLQPPLAVPAR